MNHTKIAVLGSALAFLIACNAAPVPATDPTDLTEANAQRWTVQVAQGETPSDPGNGQTAALSDDAAIKRIGATALRVDAAAAFRVQVGYTLATPVKLDPEGTLQLSLKAKNTEAFQKTSYTQSPTVLLYTGPNDYFSVESKGNPNDIPLMEIAKADWVDSKILLNGLGTWNVTKVGNADWNSINAVSISFDSFGFSPKYQVWLDGLILPKRP
jgi:hypothetical protein